jgi:hypothetical protein
LRFDQLCFGARNFRSRLAELGVGSSYGSFAPLQLPFPRDPKLFRCVSRNFSPSRLSAQAERLLSIEDAQHCRKDE